MTFNDILSVLKLERETMDRLAHEEGAGKTGALIVFVTGFVATLLGALLTGDVLTAAVGAVFGGLFAIVGVGIGAGIIHLFAKLFGGQGRAVDLFVPLAYAYPIMVISVIPVLGILASIYLIVVEIVAASTVERISTGRAAAAVLIPVAIIVAIIVALGLTALMALWSVSGTL